MMFDYQEIGTIRFQDHRFYTVSDDKIFPSITSVLGSTASDDKKKSLQAWRDGVGHEFADKYTRERADSGELVHSLVEQYMLGNDIDLNLLEYNERLMFSQLKMYLKKVNRVYGQEVALYSDSLFCAGRCDMIGVYDDKESIIDFKTSGRVKSSSDIEDYWLQCAFYANAHNEMFGTEIQQAVILMSNFRGPPQKWKKDISGLREEVKNRIDTFYSRLD